MLDILLVCQPSRVWQQLSADLGLYTVCTLQDALPNGGRPPENHPLYQFESTVRKYQRLGNLQRIKNNYFSQLWRLESPRSRVWQAGWELLFPRWHLRAIPSDGEQCRILPGWADCCGKHHHSWGRRPRRLLALKAPPPQTITLIAHEFWEGHLQTISITNPDVGSWTQMVLR